MAYDNTGNITSKSDVGDYNYTYPQPHAVSAISNYSALIPTDVQNVIYNPFLKTSQVLEGPSGNTSLNELDYLYGPDHQRRVAYTYINPSHQLQQSITYCDGFEDVNNSPMGGANYQVHYIRGTSGLVAIDIRQNGNPTDNMYYIHTDHLGSIMSVYDANGNFVYNQSFDAWGNYRDPNTWAYVSPTAILSYNPPSWLIRGYTGHEHLNAFGLINMNGRTYDPLIARILSPDNYLQQPGNTQNYNRYSYCLNNPMKYSDPNGEWFELVVGAILGGVEGGIIGASHGAHGWGLVGDILAGAGIGALSGGAAMGVTALGGGAGLAGAAAGAAAGYGFSALGTGNFGKPSLIAAGLGAGSGFIGGLVGASIGGGVGALTGGGVGSGLNTAMNEVVGSGQLNATQIGESVLMGGGTSWAAYYSSSYLNYKLGGGDKMGVVDVSFKQYLGMQSAFQLSRFYGKEYGGLLCDDGSYVDWSGTSSGVDMPDDQDAIAQFHTHWDAPDEMRYTLASNPHGNYIDPHQIAMSTPVGQQINVVGASTVQYIDNDDENACIPELIFNRYDGTYYPGEGADGCRYNWYPINPPIERFVWSFLLWQ